MKNQDSTMLVKSQLVFRLAPAKQMTVGVLRVAMVPQAIQPAYLGEIKAEWLEPIRVA